MIPLFKTHASIGKSVLRISDVKRIVEENSLEEVYIVEDSMSSFPESVQTLKDKLKFGYRFSIYNENESDDSESKMIAFADGDEGCKDLYKLYTRSFNEKLKSPWRDYENLLFVVPFYDSFLHKNLISFSNCMPDLPKDCFFFIENNNLPFDHILEEKVKKNCGKNFKTVKSIYYENKEDVEAYQAYRCICNCQPGRELSISNPRLDHFGSDRFCFQSWKEDK